MLCIGRYVDQSILIGDDIIIKVLEVTGERVRLGIDAPRDVPVDREELRHRKRLDQLLDKKEEINRLIEIERRKFDNEQEQYYW